MGINPAPPAQMLTATDGTTIDILRYHKTEKPGPGADGAYGLTGCDDDGNGKVDDEGEFELNGRPAGPAVPAACVAGPARQSDDVAVAIPTRPAGNIRYIVLHSTAGKSGTRFNGEVSWAAHRRNLYWAHYYVGKDGTIVQISEDTEIANHVIGNNSAASAGNGINNDNAIGIEIYNNSDTSNYPGRQISAVVRLCDLLVRLHPNITRPSAANPLGNIITHAEQDATPGRKSDPTGQFRTGEMAPVSLESIVRRALHASEFTGIINTKGGDALGAFAPGQGGNVVIEAGVDALASDYDDSRTSLNIGAGQTTFSGSTDRLHLLVDDGGVLKFDQPTTLDLDGVLYVAPNATLDLRGGFDGADGRNLTITADGFALILGRVLLNGTDKLDTTELAPFNQPPFPAAGSGQGKGGSGGKFSFRTAAPGPVWVPTIVTRGGDADDASSATNFPGGAGGSVEITAPLNAMGTPVNFHFEGYRQAATDSLGTIGIPDFLPPPPPFNFMPVTRSSSMASGTCPAPSIPTPASPYLRPVANERLAIGREILGTRLWSANISKFERGIMTVGGTGGKSLIKTNPAPTGGSGGAIRVENLTAGRIKFSGGVQLFSGAGAEKLAVVVFVVGGGCDDFKYFELPTGGLGGFGTLNGGKGGVGGAAGDITVTGTLFPALTPGPPGSPTREEVLGYDADDPVKSGGRKIGEILRFGSEGFTTASSPGSGGPPGGAPVSSPGDFGAMGSAGRTKVNGTVLFGPP